MRLPGPARTQRGDRDLVAKARSVRDPALRAGRVALLLAVIAGGATAATPTPPPKDAAMAPGLGVGTATEYRAGAPIKAAFTKPVTISPLRLRLASSPPLPQPGERVTVTLTVSNAGTAAVLGLRPSLSVVSGTSLCSALAGPVPAGAPQAGPGGVSIFAWTLTLNGIGAVMLSANVSGTIAGQGVVAGQADAAVAAPGIARLSAWLTPSPLTVAKGQWFTLEVTVSNTGNLGASGVSPAVSASTNAPLVALLKGPLPKKPLAIPPGEFRVFQFTYSANGSGTVTFSVTVTGGADLSQPSHLKLAAVRTLTTAGVLIQEAIASGTTWAEATRLRLFPPEPPPPAEPPFMSFENPAELRWQTDGYAQVGMSGSRFTDGAHAAEITFMLPGDLTLSPTGTFRPTLRLAWPPRGADTPLAPRDWSAYAGFKSDWYNASAGPLALHLTLIDGRGYRHEAVRTLPALSATVVTLDLRGAREDRLDLAHLAALELGADTTALKARPVVYLDRLRFSLPPAPPPSATLLALSRTGTAAGFGRTATGRPVARP